MEDPKCEEEKIIKEVNYTAIKDIRNPFTFYSKKRN